MLVVWLGVLVVWLGEPMVSLGVVVLVFKVMFEIRVSKVIDVGSY